MNCPAILNEGTVIEDFDVTSEWTKTSNIVWIHQCKRCLDDPTKNGIEIRHGSENPHTVGYITKTTYSLDLSDMNSLRLDMQYFASSDQQTLPSKVHVDISSTTDFSKYWHYVSGSVPGTLSSLDGQRLVMRKEDFVQGTGTSESWSNTMVAIRIGFGHYSTTTTWTLGSPSLVLDKLVKNSTSKALICIGVSLDYTVYGANNIDALTDYGYLTRAWNTMVDYNAMGQGGEATPEEVKAFADTGINFYPMFTGWLLYAQEDPLRPVPPWPEEDTASAGFTDAAAGYMLSYEAMDEIYARTKAIHDWYGIPWNTELCLTHGGGYALPWFTNWMEDHGMKVYYGRHDIGTLGAYAVGPQHHFMGFPISRSLGTASTAVSICTTQDVQDAIDHCAEGHGRYLCFDFGNVGSATSMTDSDFRAVLAHIQSHEQAGQVEVVSPHELLRQGMKIPDGAGHDVILGTINLNDGINYFVDAEGFNVGQQQTAWEEVVNYSGAPNAQVNVNRGALIPVTVPMRVKGSSLSEMQTKIDALMSVIDQQSNTLVVGDDEEYEVVASTRPDTIDRDPLYQSGFNARFTLVLMREP